jgi:hypothetical protein
VKCSVCDACFAKAIAAEKSVQTYYEKMTDLFSHVPVLRDFLTQISLDEFKHAESLRGSKKAGYHSDKVHEVSHKMVQQLDAILEDVREASQKTIKSFEDVYSFSHKLENAELNSIFIFLTTEAMTYQGDALGVMMLEMETHVGKVNKLPGLLAPSEMKDILPSVG